uniref:Uncharacterized protein n=1 Tax=Panagrolaimus sp. PS1159 TaxID=55785 RepID=A0AC35FV83_9BILA
MKTIILLCLFAVVAMAQQQQQIDSNSDERERLRECNCVKLIEESESDSNSAEYLRCASVCGKIDETTVVVVSQPGGSFDKTTLVRDKSGFKKGRKNWP